MASQNKIHIGNENWNRKLKSIASALTLFLPILSGCGQDFGHLFERTAQSEILFPKKVEAKYELFSAASDIPTDILFVIDDSGSMGDDQENLAREFESFATRYIKAKHDFRLGVISTSYARAPRWLAASTENQTLRDGESDQVIETRPPEGVDPDAWIEQSVTDFKRWVKVGTQGFSTESGIESLIRFTYENEIQGGCLSDPKQSHCFFRPNSARAIIFVSDEVDQAQWNDAYFSKVLNGVQLTENAPVNRQEGNAYAIKYLNEFFRGVNQAGTLTAENPNYLLISVVSPAWEEMDWSSYYYYHYTEITNALQKQETESTQESSLGTLSNVYDIGAQDVFKVFFEDFEKTLTNISTQVITVAEFELQRTPSTSNYQTKLYVVYQSGQEVQLASEDFEVVGNRLRINAQNAIFQAMTPNDAIRIEYVPSTQLERSETNG